MPAQSFEGAYKNRTCVRTFIRMSVYKRLRMFCVTQILMQDQRVIISTESRSTEFSKAIKKKVRARRVPASESSPNSAHEIRSAVADLLRSLASLHSLGFPVTTLRKPRGSSQQSLSHASAPPDHRHATPVHSTPPSPAPTPPGRRGLRRVQAHARALRLRHGLPRAALLHHPRRPQARRAGRALRLRPARHPRSQRHRLRRPWSVQPHPPGRPRAARAGPLRLLRRHSQGHLRPLRLPPGRHARLHRLARLRRPHRPGLDPGLQRHPRRRRGRRRRRDRAARAAALRVLRRGGQRGARRVPHVRGGQGGHRARHCAEVPGHGHRRDERQRLGHRRRRRRGHHRAPAASVHLVVPHVHLRPRAGRGERDLRSDCRPVCPVQLWSGQLGAVLRAGAAGGRGVLEHAVRQQQHDARQLHPRHDRRRLQRHLLRLRRLRQRHNHHHVNHGAQAPMPSPAPVPAADAAADVVLLRDVPRSFTGADGVAGGNEEQSDAGWDGTGGQPGRRRRCSSHGPALQRRHRSVRALPCHQHPVVTEPSVHEGSIEQRNVNRRLLPFELFFLYRSSRLLCSGSGAALCQNLWFPCKIEREHSR